MSDTENAMAVTLAPRLELAAEPTGAPETSEVDTDEESSEDADDSGDEAAAEADEAPESDEDEDAGEDAAAERPEGKKKSRGGFQKRIHELTREKYEALREAERLKDEVERLRESRERAEPRAATPPADPSRPKPTLAEFDYDQDAYTEALIEWKAEALIAAKESERQTQSARQTAEQAIESFNDRCRAFEESTPDFDDVAIRSPLVAKYTPAMLETIRDADHGPALAYYLGSHLDEAAEIIRLSPLAAAKRLGQIEARLSSGRTPTPPPSKKAPPPPPPSVKAGSPATKPMEKMSWDEFKAERERQEKEYREKHRY